MARVGTFGALAAALLWVAPLAAQQPTGTIQGRVVDEGTLQPLSGVSVMVGDRGTLSRSDGRYAIPGVPAGAQTVRARFLGYAELSRPVTVPAGGTVTLDLALATQAVAINELVVVGYGQQRAGNITGAVKQVTATDFNTGRIVSPEQLIESKVAGVQVVDNNEPGGGLSVRIRGATSINASSEPLYVIDGMPIGNGAGGGLSAGRNPLNYINPEEIESITVLKDASSAAIYGANAANGVVLITTKKGKHGTQIEYTGSVSGSQVTRLPSMLSASQFRAAVQQYAPQNVSQLGAANTDWFSLIDRSALGQEHNLAVTGAGDAMNYRISLGFLNQDGVIRGTNEQRLSLGLNYDQRFFNDHLNIQSSIKGARITDLFTPGGVLSNAAQMGPTQPVTDPNAATGFYNWPGNQLTSADNPLEILALAIDKGTTDRSTGNVQATYSMPFLDALKATVNVGYDLARAQRQTFTPSNLHSQLKQGAGGNYYERNPSELNTVLESYLNYTSPLQVVPGNIDATAGYSFSQFHGEYPYVSVSQLSTNLLGTYGIPSATQYQPYQDIEENRLISFFGRANYNLNDKYLASVSVRRDGSSRFGPGNAWGTFPAFSLAWRLSQEQFVKNMVPSLSDLKLRASWGKTGNQAFSNYQQYSRYVTGDAQTQVQFGNTFVPTIRPSAFDPNIKWESTASWDFGLDYGILNQRFSGALDYYNKKTTDVLFNVPVAAGSNLSNYLFTNIGSMRNRGVEASLSARILDGGKRGLGWTADFNASHNSNELLSINKAVARVLTGLVAGGVGTYIQELVPGQPINSFYVYEHKMKNGKPIYEDNNGLDSNGKFTNQPDGTINEQDLYVDVNHDGHITVDDRVAFHDPAPKWILGQSSNFTFRNFDASYTLRAYLGNWVYNNVASNLGTYSEVTRGSPYNLQSSVLTTGFRTPQYLSDYYVENASFLRMDNAQIGYSFNYQGRPLRAFVAVQSAFTITNYSGVDPTAGLNGLDNNIYPRSRTFTGGLNVRF